MTAYDILTADAAALDSMTAAELAAAETKLSSLLVLGVHTVCNLSVAAGLGRLMAEDARRDASAAAAAAHYARHGEDIFAALMCAAGGDPCPLA